MADKLLIFLCGVFVGFVIGGIVVCFDMSDSSKHGKVAVTVNGKAVWSAPHRSDFSKNEQYATDSYWTYVFTNSDTGKYHAIHVQTAVP